MSSKLEERKLRTFVRGYLTEAHNKKIVEGKKTLKEEKILRGAIRQLLQEKESVVPGASTGQNELESVLVSIIPAVESDYKKMTTDPEQRKSYRAHIVRAAIDVLLSADAAEAASEEEQAMSSEEDNGISKEEVPDAVKADLPDEAMETLKEQQEDDIKINIGDDDEENTSDDSKMIDIKTSEDPDDKTKTKEEIAPEAFTIPGQDLTGRNISLRTWNKRGIGTSIKNGYKLLTNPKDRKIYFDYLLTNLKLYFDKFEKELQATVEEPTTPAYEKIKQAGESYSGSSTMSEGKNRKITNEKKRLVESTKLSDQILAHLLK